MRIVFSLALLVAAASSLPLAPAGTLPTLAQIDASLSEGEATPDFREMG